MSTPALPIDALRPRLDRFQKIAGAGGVLLLVLCGVGAIAHPADFFRSYLVGFLLWMGIALGSLAVLMLHHLTGGEWGHLIRRLLEAATRTLPVLLVLMLPLLANLGALYEWAHPDVVAKDALLQHKAAYLNVPFFLGRTALYFAVWIGLSLILTRLSRSESTGANRLEGVSGPGLVVLGLTVTFASIDWVMSLEPHWLSTVYGVLFLIGGVLATFAFMIAMVYWMGDHQPLKDLARPAVFHDLGNLMMAFVLLWAYISFSQFLIIWAANLPEEIPWYLRRLHGGWQAVALILVLFHFFVPFLILLFRRNKRIPKILAGVACGMLVVRLLDVIFMVKPAFHESGMALGWMDFAAPLGVGGLWFAAFLWQLKARSAEG